MTTGHVRTAAALLLAALALAPAPRAAAEEAVIPVSRSREAALRIGMMRSMFRDVPNALVNVATGPFTNLIESHTGMSGSLDIVPESDQLARRLNAGELELGVFHGFEFAWAKAKHPDLEPVVVAVPQYGRSWACLVVAKDSSAKCFADLSGQTVAMPRGIREYARLYFDRKCKTCDAPVAFGRVSDAPSAEYALDEVAEGAAQGAVVDALALQLYANQKPKRFARLKIACKSEPFPLTVIACRKGTLPEGTVSRIRQGLTNAGSSQTGKSMMGMWKLSGFEPVPADYHAQLERIAQAYPAPASETASK